MSDAERIAHMREIFFTALLSDSLDQAGERQQAMHHRIRPLDDSLVLVGRARTAAFMEVWDTEPEGGNPYELEMDLIDSLKPDEIPVFACGDSGRVAPWGDLLTTAARARGAAGVVMDGCVRDIRAIRKAAFPVFHGGIAPLDTKGRARVMALDVPIVCAGVRVSPGDLVFGDADGLVVIPQAAEAKVLGFAEEKLRGETKTLDALRAGASLRDVFAQYGIL
ncbi:RraA family protein [Acidisoma cladoniae]|uniref:RraA family protein n=1 Tax=Acidisoma cladoniae TaxID=3040935 RepID=UPI0025510E36|nr:RraA family protein [Acidisoma sp. PAMC 29798]